MDTKRSLKIYSRWRKKDKIDIFVPRTVAEVKLGKRKNTHNDSSSCASCGSGCSGGGCSGPGCGANP